MRKIMKDKMKRLPLLILTVLLILAIPLSAFGCAGLTDQQIVSKVIETSNSIKSVKLAMDISENVDITADSQSENMSVKETGIASVDNVAKEMMMNATMDMVVPNTGKQSMTMDEYLTGGYIYMKADLTGTDQWTKMKIDESQWTNENQLAQQIEFLRSAISVSRLNDETVNGLDCYVFQITPDMSALIKWVQSQSQSNSELKNLNPNMFKTTTLKMWMDKKSLLPQKESIDLTMELTPADIGATTTKTTPTFDNMTMTMNGDITYSDYNIPVTIELPAAAENAVEMPQPNQ
jgi:hypothetical protein